MKRLLMTAGGLVAVALLTVGVATSWGSSGAAPKSASVTIQSWLQVTPSATGLSGTVKACFRLNGYTSDQGGAPSWSDESSYAAVPANHANLAGKCGAWTPVGGAVFVPPTAQHPSLWTLYAVHTITGKKGQIYITFSGVYNLTGTAAEGVPALNGSGTWVITGGTDAYKSVHGEGTWTADASTLFDAGYIRHTENGVLSKSK
jgi:hypothetical protein